MSAAEYIIEPARVLLNSLANFAFPPVCGQCHRLSSDGLTGGICSQCWATTMVWREGQCQRCGGEAPAGNSLCRGCLIPDWGCSDIRTIGPFQPPLSEAIHRLKYSDARRVARRLGDLLAARLEGVGRYLQARMVLAVPLHPARRRERGYNQAQLLAERLGQALRVPAPEGLLSRARNNQSQTTLNKEQRRRNVDGIFAVTDPGLIKGRRIILVDDVLTTGATIGSCGHALLAAGASEVLACTAAAAPL